MTTKPRMLRSADIRVRDARAIAALTPNANATVVYGGKVYSVERRTVDGVPTVIVRSD